MNDLARMLIIIGGSVLALGIILFLISKSNAANYLRFLGQLPGDLRFEKGSVRIYVPLATSLLLSLLLTGVLALWNWWGKR